MSDKEAIKQHSQLSGTQVLWCTGLIVALLFTKLGLGGYELADETLERYLMVLWCALIVLLTITVSRSTKFRGKKLVLWLLTPLAVLASLGGCAGLARLDQEHPTYTEKTTLVGDVRINLISEYEVSYYEISSRCRTLELERLVLNGLLKQKKTLLDVRPADSADFTLMDQGKKIRFTSPAVAGRKAIVRIFETDWNSPHNRHEFIEMTPEELKGAVQSK